MKPGESVPAGRLLDGRYRVSRVIGQGGMGRVYLANDTRLANRPVAVKEMTVGAGEQEKKAIEDFSREARVLAALSHPGIPNLFDYFVENERHYLVMEFVSGGDLQAMLDKLGPGARVAESKVLRWARQILEVLVFLHAQKPPIIYRDFKPGNIMIDKNGRAMLIDFGIARFLPPGGRGTQIGSVGYAPPEQYMGKAEPRSDLYSLAATMHQLLTGRDPQLEAPFSFPPLRQLAPEVSTQAERAVMRALEREIDERPASAREMIDALPLAQDGDDEPAILAPRRLAPESTMPTVVLSQPAAVAAQPSKKASLEALSRSDTPRTLKAPQAPSPQPPAPPVQVSSTARTRDLTGNRKKQASGAGTGSSAMKKLPIASAFAPAASVRQATPRSLSSLASAANGRAASIAAAPEARLIAKTERAEFAVSRQKVVIGRLVDGARDPDIGIDLSSLKQAAERVSRRHAEIVQLGRDYFIRDLGSLNGTYIAGRGRLGRDQLYKLNDRDEVVLGGARLEFRKG